MAHSSVLAVVDATRTSYAAQSVRRLLSQLHDLDVTRVAVLVRARHADVPHDDAATDDVTLFSNATYADDLETVAQLLRDNDNVVIISGDIALHTRALRAALTGTTSRVLVSRRIEEGAYPVRIDKDRVASAGSAYHSVGGANGSLLDVVGVGAGERLGLADRLERWRDNGDSGSSVASIAAVALVRSGAPVRAADIREFRWLRVLDDAGAQAAEATLADADEDTLAVHSAVKAEDEAFTTFLVSPYSRYIARWCARRGIRPNAVTIVSILLGAAAAVGFGFGTRAGLIVGAVLLQVSFVLDCVDGQLARYTATFSSFGAWLDITFDRAKEYAVYAGLAVGADRAGLGNFWPWALAALVIRVSRHLVDFSFAARPAANVRVERDLLDPTDGVAAARGSVERASRRMDGSAALKWARKMAVLPFGQRFALISLTAAIADARVTFYALVPWAGAAGLYSTTGRVLRSLAR